MKKLFIALVILALPISFLLADGTPEPAAVQNELQNCIEKYDSGFDRPCRDCKLSQGTYQVRLKNNCETKVDLMCCVQNQYKRWRCFHKRDMGKNDTLLSFDCKGTGKYLKWVRNAGDESVVFPSAEEVNQQYSN